MFCMWYARILPAIQNSRSISAEHPSIKSTFMYEWTGSVRRHLRLSIISASFNKPSLWLLMARSHSVNLFKDRATDLFSGVSELYPWRCIFTTAHSKVLLGPSEQYLFWCSRHSAYNRRTVLQDYLSWYSIVRVPPHCRVVSSPAIYMYKTTLRTERYSYFYKPLNFGADEKF